MKEAIENAHFSEQRAIQAEKLLSQTEKNSSKMSNLEQELHAKEETVRKLRYDLVQLQSHLSEAMKKLRYDDSDEIVDRKLLANLLIRFFALPSGDSKRFEILSIISNVLKLDDSEKVQIGLLKAATNTSTASGKATSDSSFTDMWIAFLLKEVGVEK